MKRNERVEDLRQTLIAALQGWQADMCSAMPGIIQSVDFAEQSCVVQLAVQMQVTDPETGAKTWVSISPLLDAPLYFPHGGLCSITFPVAAGDECLVVFASRCIDAWFETGEVSPQALLRMHDLSDGFVLAGFRSKPNVISGISSTKLQIRSQDGMNVISLDAAGGEIDITAANKIKMTAPLIEMDAPEIQENGAVLVTGALTADGSLIVVGGTQTDTLSVGGHPYNTHIHTGGTLTGGHTGPPV